MKDGDAILMATLIRMKQEGYKPDRDIILALAADEEGGNFNGVEWLVKNHRDLVDAEFVLNHDGGGVVEENGKLLGFTVDASEKVYADYQLSSLSPGGHSSMPTPDNPIYHLADALGRLAHYTFPFELNAVTRAELAGMAEGYPPEKAALVKAVLKESPDGEAIAKISTEDAILNSTMRTTCVATRLAAGHANNALPQTATANVNCRILPGHSREEIEQGYADETVRFKLQLLTNLGQWLKRNRLAVANLDEPLVEAFLKCKHRERRGELRTLQQFLDHLRKQNVVPARNLPCDRSPLAHILNRYEPPWGLSYCAVCSVPRVELSSRCLSALPNRLNRFFRFGLLAALVAQYCHPPCDVALGIV